MLDLAHDILNSDAFFGMLDRHAKGIGFSKEMLRWGFSRMAERWTTDAFVSLLRREAPFLLRDESVFRTRIQKLENVDAIASEGAGLSHSTLLLVSASTVPSAAFQDAILPLLLPLELSFRPAQRLAPFFEEVFEFLYRRYPALSQRVHLLASERNEAAMCAALARHDVVNVSGSDTSMASFKRMIASLPKAERPRLIAHGHRLSAMVLRQAELEHLDATHLAAMAVDLSVWDQGGCLSPKCLFIESDAGCALALASRLVEALDHLALSLPALEPDLASLAEKNNALRMSQIDGAVVMQAQRNRDAIVVHPKGAAFEPLFLPRCLNVYPCRDALAALAQLSPYGQAIGSLTPIEDKATLSAFGYHYFAPFGQMQDPPLDWFHDNIGTLKPLLKF